MTFNINDKNQVELYPDLMNLKRMCSSRKYD